MCTITLTSISLEQHTKFFRYFGDKDIEGMFATLQPLHDLLARVSHSSIPPSQPSLIVNREPRHFERYLFPKLSGGICRKLSIGATSIARAARMVI